METSPFTCSGFYMITVSVMKELRTRTECKECSRIPVWKYWLIPDRFLLGLRFLFKYLV